MSHNTNDLDKLAQERENILLAEVAGLLHDVGKFCDFHIETQSTNSSKDWANKGVAYKIVIDNPNTLVRLSRVAQGGIKGGLPDVVNAIRNSSSPKAADFITSSLKSDLENIKTSIGGFEYTLAELIMLSTPGFAVHEHRVDVIEGKDGWLPAVIGVCHNEAHFDKQEQIKGTGAQDYGNTFLATAFGYEAELVDALNKRIQNLPLPSTIVPLDAKTYQQFKKSLAIEFVHGVGDTRHPINEVTLADWTYSVATLFKSGLAASILDNKQQSICPGWLDWRNKIIQHHIKWRILRISYDGLAFLERAATIGDMLGRQAVLHDALDAVRTLLEYTYPLGNEVYRDENGSAFVVPALDGDDSAGTKLRGLIEPRIMQAFRESKLKGEVEPHISVSEATQQAATLHTLLKDHSPPLHAFPDAVQCWWQGEPADICTACGVRPQGWGAPTRYYQEKAKARNVCYVCLDRRSNRSEMWASGRKEDASDEQRDMWQHTIWVDEVADKHGRLALITGRFELDKWLSGEMIQTMLVVEPSKAGNNDPSKNPSFARIQRVWRTTQQFWHDVWDKDIPAGIKRKQDRLEIYVDNADELDIGLYHSYEVQLDGKLLSIVWDSQKQCFITADNLHARGGAEHIQERLQRAQGLSLFQPGGYGTQRTPLPSSATIKISDVKPLLAAYTPAVKLLLEPRSFMALVPADKALDVANNIRTRYECEMSKVRNRLPLFLGVVFFGKRQPLFSALDAARRMLNVQMNAVSCTVESNVLQTTQPKDLSHDHFNKWQEISLKTNSDEHPIWRISTVMGDGQTDDNWYPYMHVVPDAQGNLVTDRKQFPHKDQSGEHWVHVSDVQEGDRVMFTPSRFSFLYLDTSARRFEAGTSNVLPIEELERIRALWENLKELARKGKLSESQLHAVVALLTNKAKEWENHGPNKEIYANFAEAVIRKEGLSNAVTVDDVTSDRLLRTFELYKQILKEPLVKKQAEESTE